MNSVLNELKNSKHFHEKISILYRLQELSLFKSITIIILYDNK